MIIIKQHKKLIIFSIVIFFLLYAVSWASKYEAEPVAACISPALQAKFSQLNMSSFEITQRLSWNVAAGTCCNGFFSPEPLEETLPPDQIKLKADQVELTEGGCSRLQGNISVQQNQHLLQANTAYIHRNAKTGQIERIELLDHIQIREPGKKIVADYAIYDPIHEKGVAWNGAYKIDLNRAHSILPGWGQAKKIQRTSEGFIYLDDASFSTCSPLSTSWRIVAKKLELNPKTQKGIAKHTTFRVFDKPVMYLPYLSFPISGKRQSGFLTPTIGFTNIGGYNISMPYYWNIAPNYDATIVPQIYTLRGLMMGSEFRYLLPGTSGQMMGSFLPNDQMFAKFLTSNEALYPQLANLSKNRWSFIWRNQSELPLGVGMNVDYQKVSDDYYFQDFSNNLSVMTQNQILRQGELNYQTEHWYLRGMLQSYQTLQPINQSFVTQLYARQPQIMAQGQYDHVLGGDFNMNLQYDQFQWIGAQLAPQGPRFHLNPNYTYPIKTSWGYVKPGIEMLNNFYQLDNVLPYGSSHYSVAIPRYSMDSGLYFDKYASVFGNIWQQTVEPRLYYLYVPYQNQTQVPAFESAYMIFNTDQVFRSNRFSGFDRIGDTNQLSYSLTSRWINPNTGLEKVALTVGQIGYFQPRKLGLCYSADGQNCVDNPISLGYLSPNSSFSPVASRLVYTLTPNVSVIGNYSYDGYTNSTNNGDINVHFQPAPEKIIHLGYSFLVNGNVISGLNAPLDQQALNQVSAGYAWPLNEKWSTLAIYSYNISNSYEMLSFGGVQYDSCCWAFRFMGGRVFQSLEPQTLTPQYNNNIYFQVLLKGIGSAANNDPAATIQTYLPGLYNIFKH